MGKYEWFITLYGYSRKLIETVLFMGYSQKLKHSVGFEPIHLTPAMTLYQLCCNITYIKQNGLEP